MRDRAVAASERASERAKYHVRKQKSPRAGKSPRTMGRRPIVTRRRYYCGVAKSEYARIAANYGSGTSQRKERNRKRGGRSARRSRSQGGSRERTRVTHFRRFAIFFFGADILAGDFPFSRPISCSFFSKFRIVSPQAYKRRWRNGVSGPLEEEGGGRRRKKEEDKEGEDNA